MRLAVVGPLVIGLGSAPANADPTVPIPDTYRMEEYRAPVPDTVPGADVLHIPAMEALVNRHDALMIDVLPAPRRPPGMRPGAPWLPVPHPSLPGSIWWPEIGRGAIADSLAARIRQRLTKLTQTNPAQTIVFFCLADCWMSWNAARRVGAMGFHAAWFPEGVDGWQAARLPTQNTSPEELE